MSAQDQLIAEAAACKRTRSFICELPLRVTPAQERTLLTRLEAARQFYNACLGEAERWVGLVRQPKTFQRARALPNLFSRPGYGQRPHAWKGGGLGNRAPKLTSPPAWQGAVHVKCRTSHLGVASQLQALES